MRLLIVDGYNAVHAWPGVLAVLSRGSLEDARNELVRLLGVYGARRDVRIVVVFDAHQRAPSRDAQCVDGVEVRFGHRQASADHIIERAAMDEVRRGRAQEVAVATSDHLQREMVHGMGVATMATLTLEAEVQRAIAEVRAVAAESQRRARRGGGRVEERVDPAVRARLERLRRGQE